MNNVFKDLLKKNRTLLDCVSVLIMLLLAQPLFAAESVRMKSTTETVLTGTTSTTINLNLEGPSGDATAESAPAKMYLPIQKNDVDSKDYFITSRSNAPLIFDTTDTTHVFNIPLIINTNADARYLYAAVKDSSTFKIIRRYSNTAFSAFTTNGEVTFAVSPQDICKVMIIDCASLAPTSTSAVEKSFTVYFFLSNNGTYLVDGSQSPASTTSAPENTGIYYQVIMSNRVYSASSITTTITQVNSGDKRVVLVYSASASLGTYAKSVRVYDHQGSPSASKDLPIGQYTTGALTSQVYDYKQASEITVTGLTNQTTYNLSVVLVDKFNFATTLSDDALATPKTIEELLKEQSCFLLTAGFGEEHFIIKYFRDFRDHTLSNYTIGRLFIKSYYQWGPMAAKMIYQHEWARAVVRSVAYLLYYLFTHVFWVFGTVFSMIFLSKLQSTFRES